MRFVLIPGAGTDAWFWHRVVPLLGDAVPVELPFADDAKHLSDYVDVAVAAAGDAAEYVVVGQSLGGFTAPQVAERLGARALILLTAMIPRPGETPGEYWANTGCPDFGDDPFYHDLPDDLRREAEAEHEHPQSGTPMGDPWPLERWPDVPTAFVLCEDDRVFPADWMRGVVRDRLGIEPLPIPGGHCAPLSRPREVAAAIHANVDPCGV